MNTLEIDDYVVSRKKLFTTIHVAMQAMLIELSEKIEASSLASFVLIVCVPKDFFNHYIREKIPLNFSLTIKHKIGINSESDEFVIFPEDENHRDLAVSIANNL